jgi:hypothetical protein
MMTHIQKSQWFVLVITLLIVGVLGCRPNNDRIPTTPEISKQGNIEWEISVPQANFYVNRGLSDQIGAFVGRGFFMVQVPAGTYRLEYFTDLGIFNLVFRPTANVILLIGLEAEDRVQKAVLYRGTITDPSKEKQEYKNLTLFSWPGGPIGWWEVFKNS